MPKLTDFPMNFVFTDDDKVQAVQLFTTVSDMTASHHLGADLSGYTRRSYGLEETVALNLLQAWAQRQGLASCCDRAGNLIVCDKPERLLAADPEVGKDAIKEIWMGSHLDSVPCGGNFDGLAGVVAGLICLRRAKLNNVALTKPLKVIGLRGEESAWFGKPYLGSSALFGKLTLADMERPRKLFRRDTGPETLGEVLANRFHADKNAIAAGIPIVDKAKIAEFWELHIEQGPVLEHLRTPVAIVDGIRGNIRYADVQIHGEDGHSGAVPRELRHDAVLAFAELASKLDTEWSEALAGKNRDLVFTIGQVETDAKSHGVTRIPGWVKFCLEWRSKSKEQLGAFLSALMQIKQSLEVRRGVRVDLHDQVATAPAKLDLGLIDVGLDACQALGIKFGMMTSGAGHDAAVFANEGIPTGMIFIRNANGSHNPNEGMDLNDFMDGCEVLYKVVTR